MVQLVKKCEIFSSSLFVKTDFGGVVDREQAFLDHIKTSIKKVAKISIFPNGLVHSFGIKFFDVFFFLIVAKYRLRKGVW